MSFHALAIVTCIAALLLGLGWLTAGTLMLKRWRIEPSVGALLIGRRISVAVELFLLLGLGALLLAPLGR